MQSYISLSAKRTRALIVSIKVSLKAIKRYMRSNNIVALA